MRQVGITVIAIIPEISTSKKNRKKKTSKEKKKQSIYGFRTDDKGMDRTGAWLSIRKMKGLQNYPISTELNNKKKTSLISPVNNYEIKQTDENNKK